MASVKTVSSAGQLRKELGKMFLEAKTAGSIKEAAYIAQTLLTALKAEADEKKAKEAARRPRTSLDDLVDMLGTLRGEYANLATGEVTDGGN